MRYKGEIFRITTEKIYCHEKYINYFDYQFKLRCSFSG